MSGVFEYKGGTIRKGQKFLMSSKATPEPRLFQYIGRDLNYFDETCNHVVVELLTGEVSHVELGPWLKNRTITLKSDSVTAIGCYVAESKEYKNMMNFLKVKEEMRQCRP